MVAEVVFTHDIFLQQRHGGVSRYFARLAAGLPSHGFDVVAAPVVYLSAHWGRGLRLPGVLERTRPRRWAARFDTAVEDRWLRRRPVRPRIVHTTYYRFPDAPGRRVMTVYDLIHERYPASFVNYGPHVERMRRTLPRADAVIAISRATRDDLLRFYPDTDPARVAVVHLGTPGLGAGPERSPFPTPYVLQVGSRSGYKNVDLLFEALAGPDLAPVRLACAGGGRWSRAERDRIARLGLSGRVQQADLSDAALATAYRHASALVIPSLHEGFGLPAVEAMHADVPLVLADTPALREVAGAAAAYFSPSSASDLARTLADVLGSERRRAELVAAGRVRRAAFTPERMVWGTARVYRRVLDGQAPGAEDRDP